jgi:hypothetical protein
MMGRPVNRQKGFFVDAIKDVLTEATDGADKKLAGAKVSQADASTLILELPSTLGPGPRYSITIRENL